MKEEKKELRYLPDSSEQMKESMNGVSTELEKTIKTRIAELKGKKK